MGGRDHSCEVCGRGGFAGGEWVPAMGYALKNALRSPDPSTQNGALLLLNGVGRLHAWNDLPPGVVGSAERWERPEKYAYVEHAERAAIYQAAANGFPTDGGTLVCVWAACADCARAIVGSGIERLVRLAADNTDSAWRESIETGDQILRECGVEVVEIDPAEMEVPALRRDGSVWP